MKFKCIRLIVVALSTIISLFTTQVRADSGIVLGFETSSGGDTIAEFSDGTSQDMGDGVGIYAGYQHALADSEFTFHGTIGYSFDDPDVVNGSTEIERIRIQLTISRDFEPHQIGVGMDIHKNVELTQRVGSDMAELKFDDAIGGALQYAYHVNNIRVGLRYVDIEYEINTQMFDASNFGVFVDWVF